MRITNQTTDAATLVELGARLKRTRLEHNLTQDKLAEEAGVSRPTVTRIESGQSAQFTSVIRILRYLGLLEAFDRLVPEPPPSPIDQLRRRGKERMRARPQTAADEKEGGAWHWGDEGEAR